MSMKRLAPLLLLAGCAAPDVAQPEYYLYPEAGSFLARGGFYQGFKVIATGEAVDYIGFRIDDGEPVLYKTKDLETRSDSQGHHYVLPHYPADLSEGEHLAKVALYREGQERGADILLTVWTNDFTPPWVEEVRQGEMYNGISLTDNYAIDPRSIQLVAGDQSATLFPDAHNALVNRLSFTIPVDIPIGHTTLRVRDLAGNESSTDLRPFFHVE